MKLPSAFLSLLLLASPALAQVKVKLAHAGTVTFDCARIPEVCNNMCWGVHCRMGRYGTRFTYDPEGQDARRRTAGCGPNNRCSQDPRWAGKGLTCDEFPFANSREADAGGQNSRCVPSGQNNSQGGTLSTIVNRMNRAGNTPPWTYDIAFMNPAAAGVKYCSNAAKANPCQSDDNLIVNGAQAPNPAKWTARSVFTPTFYHYRTRAGQLISSGVKMEPGHKLYMPTLNKGIEAEALTTRNTDVMNEILANPDNYLVHKDEVEHIVTPEEVSVGFF